MIRAVFSNAQDKVVVHNVNTQIAQLTRFSAEINLTEEEINVIIFTSLDLDFFTNLLISAG